MLGVRYCVAGCVWFAVQKPTEWQHIGDEIDAVPIFARVDFVKVGIAIILFQLRLRSP
jgi:hypothetical protein